MKKLLLITFLGIFLHGLWATGSPEGVTTIEWWSLETQTDRQEKIKVLVDVFETINPNIKIVLVPVDQNDLAAQVAAATAAGTLPDVIKGPSQIGLAFNEEGIIDNSVANAVIKEIGEDEFYRGALDTFNYQDNYFGVPFHFFIQGIWYRQDWFDKAGLAPPNTLDNILKAAKYFYKPQKNQYGILVGTQADSFTEQVYTQIAIANEAYEIGTDGSIQFGDNATKNAISYYKKLAQYNPPGPQTWRARDYYLQGKLAMFFYSSYIMDDLAIQDIAEGSLSGENFDNLEGASFDEQLVKNTGVVTNIVGTQGSGYGDISALFPIKKPNQDNAKQKAVKTLIEFLLEDSNYIPYLHMAPGGMLPVKKSTIKDENFYSDQKGVYSKYTQKQISDLIQGLNSLQSFSVRNGITYPVSGQITAKNIIPQAIYDIVIKDENIDNVIKRATQEMENLQNK